MALTAHTIVVTAKDEPVDKRAADVILAAQNAL